MPSTDTSKVFADRLSDLLVEAKAKGQDYKKISSATGISTGALSNYASDKQQANISAARILADYFDVSVDYLLGRTADPRRQPSIADDLGISDAALKTLRHLHTCETDLNITGALDRLLCTDGLVDLMITMDTIAKTVKKELFLAKAYEAKTSVSKENNFPPQIAMMYEEQLNLEKVQEHLARDLQETQYFHLVNNQEYLYLELETLFGLFRRYIHETTGYRDLQRLLYGDPEFPFCYSRNRPSIPNKEEE